MICLERPKIYKSLISLSEQLEVNPPSKERLEYLADMLAKKLGEKRFLKAMEWLLDNWTYQRYPSKIGDFIGAYNKCKEAVTEPINQSKKYESWQYEYASKLGLRIDQLPYHASLLSPEQRQKLDLIYVRPGESVFSKLIRDLAIKFKQPGTQKEIKAPVVTRREVRRSDPVKQECPF